MITIEAHIPKNTMQIKYIKNIVSAIDYSETYVLLSGYQHY